MYKDNEIISKEYSSNCLFEAVKAKVKNPNVKIYFCLPYIRSTGIGSSHVLWEDDQYTYDFSDLEWSDSGHFWQYFWYKGVLRRWPKEFARQFSEKRNRQAKKSWARLFRNMKNRMVGKRISV